ncbi:CsbD family protein [uncultured Roseobacter sp.]|uniref:CsbD family protein n=1 Tax=uncultured Roseobacter sp. TaxID=114847 RepID=UPI002620B3B6|nr:CsbD family protein [uncultured Roseobacter sp.]
MNWDIIKGNWKQMKGQVQSKWGELTDDEIDQAEGDRERFVGLIQERYGVAKDEAERQIDEFIAEHKSAA